MSSQNYESSKASKDWSPPLSPDEEIIFEKYRPKYVEASPDRKGLVYEMDHGKLVSKLERDHNDQTERALLFDRIIFTQKSWWGKGVEIYRTAKYDDFVNGVDLILEFLDEGNQRLALLGIDTTVSNEGTLGKKQEQIRKKISRGHLSTINYGPTKEGENVKDHERCTEVPQVDLTITPETLELLAKDLVKANGDQLPHHQIQVLLVDEVLNQLAREKFYIVKKVEIEPERKEQLIEKLDTIIYILSKAKSDMKTPLQDAKVWNDRMADYLIKDELNKKICPEFHP